MREGRPDVHNSANRLRVVFYILCAVQICMHYLLERVPGKNGYTGMRLRYRDNTIPILYVIDKKVPESSTLL